MFKKSIIILIISGFLFTSFVYAQTLVEAPKTIEEAEEITEKAISAVEEEMPGILRRTWEEKVLPIWQRMWDWFYINAWSRIKDWFRENIEPKIEEKKPIIEQELEKEKQEIKQELPKVGKSLWERFKELIK